MLTVQCTTEEKVKITAAPKSAAGNPAPIDGAVVVTVASGDGTVEPISDLEFFVVAGAVEGDTVFDVAGDADLGPGDVPITDQITLTVGAAVATDLGLSAGSPEPK